MYYFSHQYTPSFLGGDFEGINNVLRGVPVKVDVWGSAAYDGEYPVQQLVPYNVDCAHLVLALRHPFQVVFPYFHIIADRGFGTHIQ